MNLDPYTLEQADRAVDDAIRRSATRHQRWRALETLYRLGQAYDGGLAASDVPGELWDALPGVLDVETINLVLPYLTIIMASVTSQDPALLAEPLSGGADADDGARTAEVAMRYFWKRGNGTSVMRDMTHDSVVLGPGFGKVGWAHAEAEVDRDRTDIMDEIESLLESDRRDAVLTEREPRPLDDLVGEVHLTEALVEMDEPFIEYVSPYDVFVPANARRLDDCRWLALRVVMPRDEVLANDEFDRSARDDLLSIDRQTAEPDRSSRDETAGDFDDDPFQDVELFEFYDMRTRTMLVFQRGAEVALYEGPLPYSHRYSPLVMMRNFEDGGGRFWPFGDLENIAALQGAYAELWEEQRANARRAGNKWAVDSALLTDDLREMIESDQSDIVVPIDGLGSRDINTVVVPLERKGLSADVYAAKGDAQGAMREVLGLNDFQTGGVGADRMSATAAAVADGTATLRASDKKGQVEMAASRMGLVILLLCQEFLDGERVVKVTGSREVAERWVAMTKEDLRGEFRVTVEGGSTQAVNPATRQQKAVDVLTNVVPALAEYGFDPEPALRMAIRDFGLDPDIVMVRPEPEPEPAQGPPGQAPQLAPGAAGAPAGPGAAAPAPGPAGLPPDLANPDLAALAGMGGPPVPAGTAGDIAI